MGNSSGIGEAQEAALGVASEVALNTISCRERRMAMVPKQRKLTNWYSVKTAIITTYM